MNQLLALTLFLFLVGCGVSANPRFSSPQKSDLYQWIDKVLSPYLLNELGMQPRFKSQTILFVAQQKPALQLGPDSLTTEVRERVMDSLLSTAGISLVRDDGIDVSTVHHSWPDCHQLTSVDYRISIEFDAAANGQSRLRVRALEAASGKWVAGFGKTWHGRLNQEQMTLLNTRSINVRQRGHRDAPFLETESDLLAAYMAGKIRCALRDQLPTGQIKVASDAAELPELTTVLKLVASNLVSAVAESKRVPLRESGTDSALYLSGSLVKVDGDLHQLWVELSSKAGDDITKSTLQTDAYVSIRSDNAEPPAQSDKLPAKQQSKQRSRPAVATKLVASRNNRPSNVLSELSIDTELGSRSCVYEPDGRHRRDGVGYNPAECFAVEFRLYKSAYLILIRHQVNGMLSRVPIEGCHIATETRLRKIPESDMYVPHMRVRRSEWVTSESLYAIAITDKHLAMEISRHALRLPDDCDESDPPQSVEFELEWLATLDEIVAQNQNSVDWQPLVIGL